MDGFYFDPVVRRFWEGWCREAWHEGPRRIYDCLLDYTSEGETYVLAIEDRPYEVRAGDVVILPPAVRSEGALRGARKVKRHCVHFAWTREFAARRPPLQTPAEEPFRVRECHPVPRALAPRLPLHARLEPDAPERALLEQLFEALRRGAAHSHALLWPVLRLLLERSATARAGGAARSDVPKASDRAALELKHHIESHYFEDLGYTAFAELTGMSASHLCQVFTQTVGMAPAAYLREVRLQHARQMLEDGRRQVKEIAHTVGIHDANYFARAFRQRFGRTPREVREGR
ncbi:MAG: helix-turn-helix transcriptional regulator [Planctomycetota bacterium]|nr:helix-turn-helix transcriptional regulator [Planctomycetota bacterium]